MERSSTGLDANVAGTLCYALGLITGLVFLLIEQKSPYVRFHAMQSLITFGVLTVASVVSSFLPGIGGLIGMLISLLTLGLWVYCMVKAWQGERFLLPVVGEEAAKQADRMGL